MNDLERQELIEEQRILKLLLDYHVKHRAEIGMDEQEFEVYANAALDRLIEIQKLLTETTDLK